MSRIITYYKRAMSGDLAAAVKLNEIFEKDMAFICKALIVSKADDDDTAKRIGSTLSSSGGLESEDEIRLNLRRRCAALCLEESRDIIPPDGYLCAQESSTEAAQNIPFPENGLNDPQLLSEALEKIYFSMDKYEYAALTLYYFCRFSTAELAQIYGCSEGAVITLLSDAAAKLIRSLELLTKDKSKTETGLSALFDAMALYGSEGGKASSGTGRNIDPKTRKVLKAGAIIVFALLMICITSGIFFFAFNYGKEDGQSGSALPVYDYGQLEENEMQKENEKKNVSMINETPMTDGLYIYLIDSSSKSFEECGLSPDGFVDGSGRVNVYELIVIDPGTEMITPDQLNVLFTDGTTNFSEGKSYFHQSTYQADERTFIVRISAPGEYTPDQFMIELDSYGQSPAAYVLPTHVTKVEDIKGLNISNNTGANRSGYAEPKQIIDLISSRVGLQHNYFYIHNTEVTIESITKNKAVVAGKLFLYPLGNNGNGIDKNDFTIEKYPEAVYEYKSIMKDHSFRQVERTDDRTPPYFVRIDFELDYTFNKDISADYELLEKLKKANFQYSGAGGQIVTIGQERY